MEEERLLPPASAAMDKPAKHRQPACPRQKYSSKVSEALRLIGTSSAAGEIRSFKSHWLLSHAPDVSSWRRKTARELAPTPPWPPKVGNSGGVSATLVPQRPLFVRLDYCPGPTRFTIPGSSPALTFNPLLAGVAEAEGRGARRRKVSAERRGRSRRRPQSAGAVSGRPLVAKRPPPLCRNAPLEVGDLCRLLALGVRLCEEKRRSPEGNSNPAPTAGPRTP